MCFGRRRLLEFAHARHRTRRTHLAGENSLSSARATCRRSTQTYGLIQVPRACRSVKHVPLSTDRGHNEAAGAADASRAMLLTSCCKMMLLTAVFAFL